MKIWIQGLTVCGKCHDDVALVDRPEILTGKIEFTGLRIAVMVTGGQGRLRVVVFAERILINIEKKFRRRSSSLGSFTDYASRPVRQAEKIQYFVLDLAFLTLRNDPVNYRLIVTVVDVEAAHTS